MDSHHSSELANTGSTSKNDAAERVALVADHVANAEVGHAGAHQLSLNPNYGLRRDPPIQQVADAHNTAFDSRESSSNASAAFL